MELIAEAKMLEEVGSAEVEFMLVVIMPWVVTVEPTEEVVRQVPS